MLCLSTQTLKNSILLQPQYNLGWRNATYPIRTYAVIPRARGILPQPVQQDRATKTGTSNCDTWRISESEVSEHNMSYRDDATIRSIRVLARPHTLLQSILQTAVTGRRRPKLVTISRNRRLRQAQKIDKEIPLTVWSLQCNKLKKCGGRAVVMAMLSLPPTKPITLWQCSFSWGGKKLEVC